MLETNKKLPSRLWDRERVLKQGSENVSRKGKGWEMGLPYKEEALTLTERNEESSKGAPRRARRPLFPR